MYLFRSFFTYYYATLILKSQTIHLIKQNYIGNIAGDATAPM